MLTCCSRGGPSDDCRMSVQSIKVPSAGEPSEDATTTTALWDTGRVQDFRVAGMRLLDTCPTPSLSSGASSGGDPGRGGEVLKIGGSITVGMLIYPCVILFPESFSTSFCPLTVW